MALKTNYKDDGFTGNRKYRQITNADNTLSFEDVTAYNPVGDNFGAKDINDTNTAVNSITNPTFEDYTSTAVPDPETALSGIKSKASITTLFTNIKAVLKGAFLKMYLLTTKEQLMANTLAGRTADALLTKQLNQDLGGNRFGYTTDGQPGYKKAGADTVYPFSTPTVISMIQLLPGLNNYAGNVITLDVSEKKKLHIDTMQSWYDDANISIDADGTVLFSKKHQTGGSNRVDTTDIGDLDISQYNLITINFSVVSKNGQGWGKLNNIVIS